MNDEQLREWYQARQARPDPDQHPPPEAMVRLVRREGSEADRMACLDHVIRCDSCRPEFELLRSIVSAEPTPARRLPGWLPLAAGVAVAVGAASLWLLLRVPDQTLRDGGGAGSVALVSPIDGSLDRGAPIRFTWRSVPAAGRYRIELVAEDGRLLFARELTDTTVTVPDSIAVPSGRYRWSVSARSLDGVVESRLETLTIR